MSTVAPNRAYVGAREDMLALIPAEGMPTRVLEVGCAEGATSARLKDRWTGIHTTGIELDPSLAEVARGRLGEVRVGDAGALLAELADRGERFDLVLCGDVLEHLVDPWRALADVRRLCPAPGSVVVSLPNVAHMSTIGSLLFRSRWPYRERGIHDRTHLRWFGRANLPELFDGAGFEEVRRKTHHRIFERPLGINEILGPVAAWIPILSRLTEYQYVSLLRARP